MTLLFDFGGVLVDLDKQRCINAFSALGLDIRPFLGTYRQGGIFSQLERGEISVDEWCNALRSLIAEQSGRPNADEISNERLVQAWEQYLLSVPADRLTMLLRLQSRYAVSLLSNTNIIHWQQAERDMFSCNGHKPHDFFEHIFLSYEMGVEKPELEIFRRVAETIGGNPREIIFFDDSEVNCAAAREAGLSARLAPAGGAWLSFFDDWLNLKDEASAPRIL